MVSIVGMILFSFMGAQLMASAMVPKVAFVEPAPLPADAYDKAEGWFSRPDGRTDDPAKWAPEGDATKAPAKPAAIFFVPPTSAFDTGVWNAPMDDANARVYGDRQIRIQASALSGAGPVWAPHYRQAVYGAFLTDKPEAAQALNVAYGDVRQAFAAFLRANPEGPIILAGHSQGALHLIRLLAQDVADKPVAQRVAAAYVIGWPISVEADLPKLGLPACTRPDQPGCILSWQSFAAPAGTESVIKVFEAANGFTGAPRKGTHMLCTNPLAGASGPGGIVTGDGIEGKTKLDTSITIDAQCDERGFLMLTSAPAIGAAVLPGNNYHVYDYALFWPQIRADARRRLEAWTKR
jgi:hypothetical protein